MVKVKLTKAEVGHLLYLVTDNEVRGEYYSPKAQYWKRSKRIKEKLMGAGERSDENS